MLVIQGAAQPLQAGLPGQEVLQQILAETLMQAANQRFLEAGTETVPASCRALYVHQGEEATTSWPVASMQCNREALDSGDALVGSQGATTCTTLIVRCPVRHIAYAAHHDSTSVRLPAEQLLAFLKEMKEPQVYLLGSFEEARGESLRVLVPLLDALHNQTPRRLQLQLACVWSANTAPLPVGGYLAHSLYVQCSTGAAAPKVLADRGPGIPRRYAYPHCCAAAGKPAEMTCIADHAWPGVVVLPSVPLPVVDAWHLQEMQWLLSLPDARVLQCCSTSPEHEPEYFVRDIRASYQWQLEQQQQAASAGQLPIAAFKWVGMPNASHTTTCQPADHVHDATSLSASCDGAGWAACDVPSLLLAALAPPVLATAEAVAV